MTVSDLKFAKNGLKFCELRWDLKNEMAFKHKHVLDIN